MPTGMQVFAADGSLIIDITDRLQRMLGSVYTGTGAGSINVPGFSSGIPFFFVHREGNLNDAYVASKEITLNGNTLSWDQYNAPVTVHYGVY